MNTQKAFALSFLFACQSEKAESLDSAVESIEEEESYQHDVAEECHPDLEGWVDPWMGIEFSTLEEINLIRAQGADCNTMGYFEPVGPLEMQANVHCSARYHSLWMGQNNVLQHESPGGGLGDEYDQRISSTTAGHAR